MRLVAGSNLIHYITSIWAMRGDHHPVRAGRERPFSPGSTPGNAFLARIPIAARRSVSSPRLTSPTKVLPINPHMKPGRGDVYTSNGELRLERIIYINLGIVILDSLVIPSLDSVALGTMTAPIVWGRGGLSDSRDGGSVRAGELSDSYSFSMVVIDGTGDDITMIDDASDGDGRWLLSNGTIARNVWLLYNSAIARMIETGCGSGLVSKRARGDEGVANSDIAIGKSLGEHGPFGAFMAAMVVTGGGMARKWEGCSTLLLPGDESTPFVNSTNSDKLCLGILSRRGIGWRGGDGLMY